MAHPINRMLYSCLWFIEVAIDITDSFQEETGEKKLEYELVFNIVHRLHDDYRPPMCNVPCRNKAVWDELQKVSTLNTIFASVCNLS